MTSVWGRERPCQERLSAAPPIASPDSSPPLESSDELSDQPTGPSGTKSLANAPAAATSVPKYSEDDLQWIFKAVLEARAPAPALVPALAPVVFEVPWKKLKARFQDVYYGKFHMNYYNFYQQCEDYFAIADATGLTQIPFAAFFLWDRISFCWQQYKWKRDGNSSVLLTWDEFKSFLRRSLGDSQAFVDTYWEKIKRDSQYQLEKVFDWAAYQEDLQAVLREFDLATIPNEEIMIRYFWECLKPSVRAQLDTWGRDLDFWEEDVKKTVNAEAKALL